MQSPNETPANKDSGPPDLDDSFLEQCSSTDCKFQRDLLCAPRPRARSRLNDSGFFEEDNKNTTNKLDSSFTEKDESGGADRLEDWASVSTYSGEILCYLLKLEDKYQLPGHFLESQPEVTNQARAVLMDWLIEVHEFYNFPQDCLYLMISLVDRYMSLRRVHIAQFQLLGMSCLLVACKYEDRFVPTRKELVAMADQAFSESELDRMERHLLESLDFDLSQPLPTFFLRRIARAAGIDLETYVVSKFLMEAAMLDSVMVTFKPSLVAAVSFSLAGLFVWEGGKLLDVVPGSFYQLRDMRPCLVRMSEVLLDIHKLGCKGIMNKYNKLGLSPSIIRSFTIHPIVRELAI